MSPPSTKPIEEFRGLKEDTVGYESSIEGFCTSLGTLYSSFTIDRHRWKVNSLTIYKPRRIFQGESVIAEVVCGEVTVHMRIERKLQLSVGVGKIASAQNVTAQITYSSDLSSLLNHDECLEVIRFKNDSDTALSLPQIAVLVRCVNSMRRTYKLIEENSYWFTYVMAETAKRIHNKSHVETRPDRKTGSWKGWFKTKEPTSEMIEQAKIMYEEQWAAFIKDIDDTINNPDSVIYEERKKREFAERQREEAELRRDEAVKEIERLKAQLAVAQ